MRRGMLGVFAGVLVAGLAGSAAADDAATCNNASGEPAIAACDRAVQSGLHSGVPLAKLFTSRGVERKRKGEIDAAIADYNRAIELNPADLFAFNNRANARRDKGDIDGAMADYGAAIRIDPDYTAAYVNRGLVHERRGAIAEARADFQAALTTPDAKYINSRGGKQLARTRLNALAGRP